MTISVNNIASLLAVSFGDGNPFSTKNDLFLGISVSYWLYIMIAAIALFAVLLIVAIVTGKARKKAVAAATESREELMRYEVDKRVKTLQAEQPATANSDVIFGENSPFMQTMKMMQQNMASMQETIIRMQMPQAYPQPQGIPQTVVREVSDGYMREIDLLRKEMREEILMLKQIIQQPQTAQVAQPAQVVQPVVTQPVQVAQPTTIHTVSQEDIEKLKHQQGEILAKLQDIKVDDGSDFQTRQEVEKLRAEQKKFIDEISALRTGASATDMNSDNAKALELLWKKMEEISKKLEQLQRDDGGFNDPVIEADDSVVAEFSEQLSLDEAFKLLSEAQRKYFLDIRDYALNKSQKPLTSSKSYLVVGRGAGQIVKLTIKKGITVAMFNVEDAQVRALRLSSGGGEIKTKPTTIQIISDAMFESARKMIDLRIAQINEDEEVRKQQRKIKRG